MPKFDNKTNQLLRGKKALVTGSNGFLGPWLCEALLDQGAVVYGLDIDPSPNSRIHDLSERMEIILANIENLDNLAKIFEEGEFEYIFHLAAQSLVGKASLNPVATFKSNIEGTWNVLECSRLLNQKGILKALIVASSDKAYGDHENLPYVETAALQGRFPYDASKSCTDLLAQSYFHSYQLPVCITRCGNIYGGGDLNFSRIVPGTIKSLILGERPIIRSDGTLIRDYVYVRDIADACVFLAQTISTDRTISGEAFNIAEGNPLKVLEIVKEISASMNLQSLEPVIESKATMEIAAQYLDSSKIRRLGWKGKFTREEALKETLNWYKTHSERLFHEQQLLNKSQ